MEQKEKIIKIYNPKDFPFGQLSNIATHEIIIDSKRWPTVENYILSNMLITPLYRLALQTAPIKGKSRAENNKEKVNQMVARIQTIERRHVDREELKKIQELVAKETSIQTMGIKDLYNHYLREEYINNIHTATEKAYNAKIFENKDLENALLMTENRPIVYVSDNDILGVGSDGNGLNFIGKILMQIRNNIHKKNIIKRKEDEEKKSEDRIFDAYKARVIIIKLLSDRNDLKKYIGKTSSEIVEYYLQTHENENLDTLGLGENIRNAGIDMYKRGQLPIVEKELENPGYMILAARRDKLKDLKERIEHDKATIILEVYTQNIIKKKYPLMEEEEVKKATKQLARLAPSTEKYLELRKQVVQMYLQGKLGLKIKELDNFPKISEEDIQEAEVMAEEKDKEEDENSNSSEGSDDAIKQLLHKDDSKTQKYLLIKKLQTYTGKSSKTYKDLSIEEIKAKLERYEQGSAPEEVTGEWVVKIKHRNNKVETIYKTTGLKPSSEQIKEILQKYNKDNNKDILQTQVFVKWERKGDIEEEKTVKWSEKIFIKYIGEPVQIYADINKNSDKLKELSPLFEEPFSVEGQTYPSVAIYITTILLTHTGITMDMKNKTINKRGTTVAKARQLLMQKDIFVSVEDANKIYRDLDFQTHRNLEEIYARIAMFKKFEDIGLAQLLALTGDATLIYNDKENTVLGVGENDGLNIAGKILTEIRTEVVENPEKYFLDISIPNEVSNLIMSDDFLKSWLQMRVSDMCSVVAKMKKYLLEVGKQKEDVSERFVTFVINLIYRHCSLPVENLVPMPEEFINMVKGCELFPEKLSRDFEKEIEDLRKEQDEYVNDFWKISIAKETIQRQTLSGEKFADLMEAFLGSVPRPSQDAIARYKASLLEEFERDITSEKVRERFDDKQKQEWKEFLEELLKPEKSYEEIQSIMNKAKRKHQKEFDEADTDTKLKLQKQHEKEREDLWISLTKPVKSLLERNADIANFNKKQEKDRLIHYGISTEPKTKDELEKYNDNMKKFTERIVRIKGQQKDELKHIKFIIQDVSHLFWNYLSTMIQYLVNSKKHTRQSVREAIVNSELFNSEKMTCKNIPINLSDPSDNCIASALANILSGIEKFKYQYAEEIPFGKYDINLATSIIIGREVVEKQNDKEEVETEEEEVETEEEEVETEEEEVEKDYEDAYIDEDENIGFLNTLDELEEEESFTFGMKKLTEPRDINEQVRMILLEIVKKDIPDIDSLVEHFLKAIESVKSSKLSEKIKLNRINFFATLNL